LTINTDPEIREQVVTVPVTVPQYWPYNPQHMQQQQATYQETLGRLYPAKLTLKPDAQWSQADCELLAMLDFQHDANRWLALQAGFYNATGRMVAVELLMAKMKEAGA
jgi:hypothetical protein